MAQIFPKWTLRLPLYAALALPVVGAVVVGGIWYFFSPEYTDVGYRPAQPVPYSHALHVGELGPRLPLLPRLGRGVGGVQRPPTQSA